MKKIIIAIILLVGTMNVSNIQAAEISGGASYDLTTGGIQSFNEIDENGETAEVTVSQDNSMLKMVNKTYTVSRKGRDWKVSYKVGIHSNKITKVSSLKVVGTGGSFTKRSLKRYSTIKAKGSAIHHRGIIKNEVHCVTNLKNKKLIIS